MFVTVSRSENFYLLRVLSADNIFGAWSTIHQSGIVSVRWVPRFPDAALTSNPIWLPHNPQDFLFWSRFPSIFPGFSVHASIKMNSTTASGIGDTIEVSQLTFSSNECVGEAQTLCLFGFRSQLADSVDGRSRSGEHTLTFRPLVPNACLHFVICIIIR